MEKGNRNGNGNENGKDGNVNQVQTTITQYALEDREEESAWLSSLFVAICLRLVSARFQRKRIYRNGAVCLLVN